MFRVRAKHMLVVVSLIVLGVVGTAHSAVNAVSGLSSVQISGPQVNPEKGDSEMTTQEPLINNVGSTPSHPGAKMSGASFTAVDGLEAARMVLGSSPLVPGSRYLPDGLSLTKVTKGPAGINEIALHYKTSNGHGPTLIITQGRRMSPSGLPVKAGYSEAVQVDGASQAHFIRGAWTRINDGEEVWDTRFLMELVFRTAEHGVVHMSAVPASSWTKEQLIQIANSLESSN